MVETHLDEVKEDVEHLEEIAPGRFKLIVTVTILVVTLATTFGALVAARAAANASAAQRDRQVMSAQAVDAGVEAAQTEGVLSERSDDSTEAGWRRTFSDQLSSDPTAGAGVNAQMQAEATQSESQRASIDATLPVAESKLTTYEANLNVPSDSARQTAAADASASAQWEGAEGAALADISMLALALFLLGLALTISHRPTATGFVLLAALILLVAVGRLGIVAARQVNVPTSAAISAYVSGDQDLNTGDYIDAVDAFHNATNLSPDYEAAWAQLGSAEFSLETPAGFAASETDLRRALALEGPDAAKGPLLNNLGFSELVAGHLQAAGATLQASLRQDPNDEVTLASLAEQAVLSHDASGAADYLAQALRIVGQHGSYFRQQYFESFRSDQDTFSVAGISTSETDAFFTKVKEAEASLDSLGGFQPGDAHGATVTDLVVRPAAGKAGGDGLATIGFDHTGFQTGDHLAIRWYQGGVTYELTDSVPDTVLDSSWAGTGSVAPDSDYVVPVTAGAQTVEIYLNGVLLASQSFDMPAATG